jgi:hypothetical protein
LRPDTLLLALGVDDTPKGKKEIIGEQYVGQIPTFERISVIVAGNV